MAEMAGIDPVVVICEMLDGETGRAVDKDAAARYARSHGLEFVGAGEILGAMS
jgi:3,4-dihydroxy 2-butanone 4-phosphate synthase